MVRGAKPYCVVTWRLLLLYMDADSQPGLMMFAEVVPGRKVRKLRSPGNRDLGKWSLVAKLSVRPNCALCNAP